MVQRTIKLHLNGKPAELTAEDDTPLIYLLRHDCDLKGTRLGCGASQCGACHVLVDGQSLPACDTPLWSVEGKQVITVEGLGSADQLHPLQQAFLDEQAAQCGYCSSGMLIGAAALLQNNPKPTEIEVRAALDKHLCRCGAHNRIVRAVLKAAQA